MAEETEAVERREELAGDARSSGGLERELADARTRLRAKLLQVDLSAIGISAYNQRYLGSKFSALDGELRHVSHLLTLGLAGTTAPLEEATLLDYGGGSGMIALLAKELGIGTVVYNDIYDVSCDDVTKLAPTVGLQLDHVICGDVDAVVAYLKEAALPLDAIVSYDALEHIYDITSFFRTLAEAPTSGAGFRLLLASGANIRSRRYVRYATRVQLTDELTGTTPEWGHKERDSVRPFLEIRRELVAAAAPQLDAAAIDELARATRGLRRDDIERAVAEYVERGAVSYRPDHPTNTCDPYTGNWSEHLMEPDWLERTVREAGFDARVIPGLYVAADGGARGAFKRLLNGAIGLLGTRALAVAPYYAVYGGKAG